MFGLLIICQYNWYRIFKYKENKKIWKSWCNARCWRRGISEVVGNGVISACGCSITIISSIQSHTWCDRCYYSTAWSHSSYSYVISRASACDCSCFGSTCCPGYRDIACSEAGDRFTKYNCDNVLPKLQLFICFFIIFSPFYSFCIRSLSHPYHMIKSKCGAFISVHSCLDQWQGM